MFSKPNYTQIPNDLFDSLLPTLKEGELRILMVIMRQTFGWQKKWDQISLSQLEKKTGMCRDAVVNALKSLIEKKLVIKTKTGDPGSEKCWYTLNVEQPEKEEEFEDFPDDSNNSYQSSKTTPPSRFRRPTKETLTKEIEKKILKEKPTRSARQPSAPPIKLDPEKRKFDGITPEDRKAWTSLYPSLHLDRQLDLCAEWAMSTPRINYRKSINIWLKNVMDKNTTPYHPPEQKESKEGPLEAEKNKRQALEWEKVFKKQPYHPGYSLDVTHDKVSFTIADGSGYEVAFHLSNDSFNKKCYTALKRMRIL